MLFTIRQHLFEICHRCFIDSYIGAIELTWTIQLLKMKQNQRGRADETLWWFHGRWQSLWWISSSSVHLGAWDRGSFPADATDFFLLSPSLSLLSLLSLSLSLSSLPLCLCLSIAILPRSFFWFWHYHPLTIYHERIYGVFVWLWLSFDY